MDTSESFISLFLPEKLARLFLLKEVKPSPYLKMIKLNFSITCFRHYDILVKTRSRMTAIAFSRQNDADSRAWTTLVFKNLVLVLKSEGLLSNLIRAYACFIKRQTIEPGVKVVLKLTTNVNNETANIFTGNVFRWNMLRWNMFTLNGLRCWCEHSIRKLL